MLIPDIIAKIAHVISIQGNTRKLFTKFGSVHLTSGFNRIDGQNETSSIAEKARDEEQDEYGKDASLHETDGKKLNIGRHFVSDFRSGGPGLFLSTRGRTIR